MNYLLKFLFPIFLFLLILKKIKQRKDMIIPVKKNFFVIFLFIIVIVLISYFYAQTWTHYGVMLLAIMLFISLVLVEGITTTGFLSMYRYKQESPGMKFKKSW